MQCANDRYSTGLHPLFRSCYVVTWWNLTSWDHTICQQASVCIMKIVGTSVVTVALYGRSNLLYLNVVSRITNSRYYGK